MTTINLDCLLEKAHLPTDVLENEGTFISTIREGIPGSILQPTIAALGERELFTKSLNTKKSNLNKYYRKERLSTTNSEAILDILRVFKLALKVYEGDGETAKKWMHTKIPALNYQLPIELLDTFTGRNLVKECLLVMEYGDFS